MNIKRFLLLLCVAVPLLGAAQFPLNQPSKAAAVLPLLKTQWGQGNPYYGMTPMGTNSNGESVHCQTGCIATAMSQILFYLYRTQAGKNESTFSASIPGYTNGMTVGGVSGNRTYNWADMMVRYGAAGSSYTQNNYDAVALIMSHCGIATEMKYTTGESTTQTPKVQRALSDYFGVSSSYKEVSISELQTQVDAELSAGRPVLISGTDEGGINGHAFVCDGRNSDGLYHINWGFGGIYDGYFSLAKLSPYGVDDEKFNHNIKIVYNFQATISLSASEALDELKTIYNLYAPKLRGFVVGDEAGMIAQQLYINFESALTQANTIIEGNNNVGMTAAQLVALKNNIVTTFETALSNRVPYPDGIYYINSYYNTTKAMYDQGGSLAWNTLEPDDTAYQWEMKYDASSRAYIFSNVKTGARLNRVTQYSMVTSSTGLDATSSEIVFEPASYNTSNNYFNEYIRLNQQSETGIYLSQKDYGNKSGVVYGFTTESLGSRWFLTLYTRSGGEEGMYADVTNLRNIYSAYHGYLEEYADLVGAEAMMYSPDAYAAFSHALIAAKAAIESAGKGYSDAEVLALGEAIKTAFSALQNTRNPYPDGVYYILAGNQYTTLSPATWTWETSSDSFGMYQNGDRVYWKVLDAEDSAFMWKVHYDSETQAYKISNFASNRPFAQTNSGRVTLNGEGAEDAGVVFEPQSYSEIFGSYVGYLRCTSYLNEASSYFQRYNCANYRYSQSSTSNYQVWAYKNTAGTLWYFLPAHISGDLNGDCKVTIADLTRLIHSLQQYESPYLPTDIEPLESKILEK